MCSKEEIIAALSTNLDQLFQKQESVPFQKPVDIVAIPKYREIIANPIDLGTIKQKLVDGEYEEPWQYINDVRQVFANAWKYNKKNALVYIYCTKVSRMNHCNFRNVISILRIVISYSFRNYLMRQLMTLWCNWAIAVVKICVSNLE